MATYSTLITRLFGGAMLAFGILQIMAVFMVSVPAGYLVSLPAGADPVYHLLVGFALTGGALLINALLDAVSALFRIADALHKLERLAAKRDRAEGEQLKHCY